MTDGMPHSIGSGTLRIFGVDLVVHTLSDGQRIIEEDSMAALLNAMASEERPDPGEIEALARFIHGKEA